MKKLLIVIVAMAFIVIGTSTAYAWWNADARIQVTRTRVQAAVRNNHGRPIECQGYAYGRTVSGHVLQSHGGGTIYPGRYGYVYVYTSPQNPFVQGWADIRCRGL